ncbi:MAG: hypothetical protein ACP5T9_05335 [Thermoplasmata archaeon]
MSFETIIIGNVVFKKNADEGKKEKVIDKVKELCEADFVDVYTDASGLVVEIAVEHRNPSSHVDGNVFSVLERYLRSAPDTVESSAFKLFYTDRPHESFTI